MAISLDDLVERLEASLADMERHNYGDATQKLTNTISAIKINGLRAVVKPERTN